MTRHLTAGEARRGLAHLPPTPEAYSQALRLRFPDAWVSPALVHTLIAERGPRPAPPEAQPLIPARLSVPGGRVQVSAHVQARWRVTEQPAETPAPARSGWASQDAPRPRAEVPSLLRAYEEGQRSGASTWSSWRDRREVPPLTVRPSQARERAPQPPGETDDEERRPTWGELNLQATFDTPHVQAPDPETAQTEAVKTTPEREVVAR